MRRLAAVALTVLGAAALVAGVAMVFVPAGVIVGGLVATAAGLLFVDDGRPQ